MRNKDWQPIQLGSEYPYPQPPGIWIVRYFGEHGGGHGLNGVHFRRGGKLFGYVWRSTVKYGGDNGYEVLSTLSVSRDGKSTFHEFGSWHHWAAIKDKDTYRPEPVIFKKPYRIQPGDYIHITGQGYHLPFIEPIPKGWAIEYQITLHAEAEEFEVK